MKTSQQRKVIHRITSNTVIKVNEAMDLALGPEDVPEREILVNEAARSQIEQGVVIFDLAEDFATVTQKTLFREKVEMLIEPQVEIIGIVLAVTLQSLIKNSKALEGHGLPLGHSHSDVESDCWHVQ